MIPSNVINAKFKNQNKVKNRPDDDVLNEAQEDIKNWFDYWGDNINRAREDIYFTFVSQWSESDKQDRTRKRKAILEFNRLYTHVMQVMGEQRQNTPSIKVRAKDTNVDQNDVDLREGILRQILYDSRSDIVFQTAFRSALCGGYGAIQIDIDYENEDSFDLTPKLVAVEDPTLVFFDPNAKEHDKSDGRFCGQYVSISKKEFERRYPDIDHYTDFPKYEYYTSWEGWGNGKNVTVADYFVKEYYTDTIIQLNTGQALLKSEVDQIDSRFGVYEVNRRMVQRYKIMHYKMIYGQILDRSEWPSDKFPFIYVDGDSQIIQGIQRTKSFIHFAKDAQQLLNYAASEAAEKIVHAQRAQWMVREMNINGNEDQWRRPELHGVLKVKYDERGNLPDRISPDPVPTALVEQYNKADNDIINILGRYQSNLGAQGNEQSGVAIDARAQQGNSTTIVYFDNLKRSIESTARVLLSLLPRVMDGTRTVSTLSANGEQKNIIINQEVPILFNRYIKNQITKGNFSVEISVGPNYQLQKMQAMDQLIKLVSVTPQAAPLLIDLIAANIDVENMPQIVERLKTMVPPQVLAKESGQPPPPPKPDPQTQLEQQKVQNETQKNQLEAEKIQMKMREEGLKNTAVQTKSAVEIKKAQMDLAQKAMEMQHTREKQHHEQLKQFLSSFNRGPAGVQ